MAHDLFFPKFSQILELLEIEATFKRDQILIRMFCQISIKSNVKPNLLNLIFLDHVQYKLNTFKLIPMPNPSASSNIF